MATIKDLLGAQIIEACSVADEVVSEECAAECVPNPQAFVPNWMSDEVELEEPYLNEKTCEYEVVIEDFDDVGSTPITAKSSEEIAAIGEDLRKVALRIFLDFYSKDVDEDEDPDEFAELLVATYVKDYSLPMVFLEKNADETLTYPTRVLAAIPAYNLDQIEEVQAEGSEFTPVSTLDISAFDLKYKLKRLIKALDIFAKWQQFNNIDVDSGTRIYYSGTKRHIDLSEFGKLLENVWPSLESLVENLPGKFVLKPNKLFKGEKNLTELSFLFGENMSLESMKFSGFACEDNIVVSSDEKKDLFKTFKNKSKMNNQVVTGLISKILEIDDDLLAREPISWYEFVQKYFNLSIDIVEGDYGEGSLSDFGCFLQSLEENTELFQTMLNQVISIPDVIAGKFAQYACMDNDDLDELETERQEEREKFRAILNEAIESENYLFDDPLWTNLEEMILDEDLTPRDIFDQLTVCGLIALLMKVIECLAGQVSFEELLNSAVKSALKAMKVKQIGNLFGLLPADKQAEIYQIVEDNLVGQGILDDTLVWPWEPESPDTSDDSSPSQISDESDQPSVKTRDTLSKQLGTATNEILKVLFETMLESIGAEDLLEYLNTFPGAEIIARVLAEADCMEPPKWFGELPPWRKTGDLPFCRANFAITLPSLPELVFLPPLQALINALKDAALDALKEFFRKLILTLLAKLISYLRSEICNFLSNLGQALTSNDTAIFDALRESCGVDSDAEVEEAIGNMFSELGSDTTAEEDVNMINNLSTALTTVEICDLLQGRASQETAQIAHAIIKYNNSSFLNVAPDPDGTRSFFKALGNYVPTKELDKLCAITSQPANDMFAGANACNTGAVYEQIQTFRRMVLERGGVSEQEVQDQLCRLNENTLDNLEQIMDALQGQGVEDIMAKQFPSLDSTGDPSCPTVQGIFAKDDPESSASGAESIDDLLDGIEKKFKKDVYGRKGFFDWTMCATDGTRLRMQNFYLKRPLLTRADEVRSLAGDLDDTKDNNYYPYTIGNKLRKDLISYCTSLEFDSTVGQTSIEASFATDDSDYQVTISYIHSNSYDPNEDSFSISRTEETDESQVENEVQGGEDLVLT